MKNRLGSRPFLLSLILLLSTLTACQVKLVSDYDAATAEVIFETAKRIDAFYLWLTDVPPEERRYDEFAEEYLSIEVELGNLVLRNQIRPLNVESAAIAESTLGLWVKYKEAHKQSDAYKDALAKLHRKRFMRLFRAMAVAEEAKRMASEPVEE